MRPITFTPRVDRPLERAEPRPPRRGFTLVELLVVLVIVGVLLALFIPTVDAVRRSVARARTQVQLAHWASACQQFRQEYGHWPAVGSDGLVATAESHAAFVRALTGRNPDGSAVAEEGQLGGNVRRIAFLTLTGVEWTDGGLQDAFGNRAFGVVFDRDDDGLIRGPGDGAFPALPGEDGTPLLPGPPRFPTTGVRASVGWYSAGAGRDAADFVTSWP